MIKPVQITLDERGILLQWRKDGGSLLTRDRAHTILLNSQGLSAHRIAKLLFRTEKTIRTWLRNFKKQRVSSLFTKYQSNTNANKLTPKPKEEIQEALGSPPSDYGIPKRFWTTRDVKKFVKVRFGVVYESDRSYHFLLQLSRLSWKLPDKFDLKRDNCLVVTRLREIRKEITPLLRDKLWVVVAGDETRIEPETQSRRVWLKKGKKTVMKVKREKQAQNFLGCLNLKTHQCHLYQLSWQNQGEILKALKKLKTIILAKEYVLSGIMPGFIKASSLKKSLKKEICLRTFT